MISVKIIIHVDKKDETLAKGLAIVLGEKVVDYCDNNESTCVWDSAVMAQEPKKKTYVKDKIDEYDRLETQEH